MSLSSSSSSSSSPSLLSRNDSLSTDYYNYLFFFLSILSLESFSHQRFEFEWQQVSLSLQDSSQYSGRSQHCYSLDSLRLLSYFQVLHFPVPIFWLLYEEHQLQTVSPSLSTIFSNSIQFNSMQNPATYLSLLLLLSFFICGRISTLHHLNSN